MQRSPYQTSYAEIQVYLTRDGSQIRELMHPSVHACRNQSLAEATVPPATRTLLHRHRIAEEIYHLTAGSGRMTLGESVFDVTAGDTVLIPPGMAHCIEALGATPLRMLCCCSPAYSHADTELIEET